MTKAGKKKLIQYFKKRLEYLEYCSASLENLVEDDKQEVLDSVNKGRLSPDDPDVGRALFRLEYLVATTFRYCMLAAICTFLEESIRMLGEQTIDDYATKVHCQKRGSWLKKQLKVHKKSGKIVLDPVQAQIQLFEDVISLRNAVVHAWGNIDACRGPDKVREIMSRYSWAQETADGYIFLDDQAVPEAMIASEDIVEHILGQISAAVEE